MNKQKQPKPPTGPTPEATAKPATAKAPTGAATRPAAKPAAGKAPVKKAAAGKTPAKPASTAAAPPKKAPAKKADAKKASARKADTKPGIDTAAGKPAPVAATSAPAPDVAASSPATAPPPAANMPANQTVTSDHRQPEMPGVELIQTPMPVRWRDLDAFNHVNNSKYLSYLEEARLHWMLGVPGQGMDDHVAPVVAAAQLNYRRPITWPAEVMIELFVERLGNTSLSIGHRIVDEADPDILYCDGNVVMVWIDRDSGRAAALPEQVREACSR